MTETPRRAFEALATALRRQQPGSQMPGRERLERAQAWLPDTPQPPGISADNVAAQVIRAAKTRDTGGPPLPELEGEAASIIAAARTRDAGGPPLPALDGVAAEIIRCGKIARGEL